MNEEPFREPAQGRGYGRVAGRSDEDLVRCGPGTLGGELLRRYWHPIARSDEVADLPKAVRVLGEDLVLFRDGSGRAGLLYPRCMHRGASLLYGKVEAEGLRCCYHGWLFDAEGHCLETPCEPQSNVRHTIRQPWYPIRERYGLIWTYMGPADVEPSLPRIPLLEGLRSDEEISCGGGTEPQPESPIPDWQDFNWWQSYENLLDPLHVFILHSRINGIQFDEDWLLRPNVYFENRADGVVNYQHRRRSDGTIVKFTCQGILPNINCSGQEDADGRVKGMIIWHVPRDDYSYRVFTLGRHRRAPPGEDVEEHRFAWGPGKPAHAWTLEDHQRWQNDYTALRSQGEAQLHSEQHLTICDRGIATLRRKYKAQARLVASGAHPIGASPTGENWLEVVTRLDPPEGLQAIANWASDPPLERVDQDSGPGN